MSFMDKGNDEFEAVVSKHYSFLEADFKLRYAGVTTVEEDPRDSYMVAKYRQDEIRVDVAWNPFAMSLSVLIRVKNGELTRREQHVYLEPFIEFTTDGEIAPIVPQIYPGMSVGKIQKVTRHRQQLFASGVAEAMCEVAKRLKAYLPCILECPSEMIRRYHVWYESHAKVV